MLIHSASRCGPRSVPTIKIATHETWASVHQKNYRGISHLWTDAGSTLSWDGGQAPPRLTPLQLLSCLSPPPSVPLSSTLARSPLPSFLSPEVPPWLLNSSRAGVPHGAGQCLDDKENRKPTERFPRAYRLLAPERSLEVISCTPHTLYVGELRLGDKYMAA